MNIAETHGEWITIDSGPGSPAVYIEPGQGDKIRVRFFGVDPRPAGFSVEVGEDDHEQVARVLAGKVDPWELGPLSRCSHPEPASVVVSKPSSTIH